MKVDGTEKLWNKFISVKWDNVRKLHLIVFFVELCDNIVQPA